MWRNLSVAEKQPFVDQNNAEKEKYKALLAEFHNKNK
jgi:hypothetical protein